MVILVTSQKKWILDEWFSRTKRFVITECHRCKKLIDSDRHGLKIHVNIQQMPQKKYFCSTACKNKFAYLK